jgi:hypothetical protein
MPDETEEVRSLFQHQNQQNRVIPLPFWFVGEYSDIMLGRTL